MADGNDLQEQIAQCIYCDYTAPEESYNKPVDEDEEHEHQVLHRWRSIQTNEFQYVCTECIYRHQYTNAGEIAWISEQNSGNFQFGQVVLAQLDAQKREQVQGDWFRAIIQKVDKHNRRCEIEFLDDSKGILTKNYNDLKQLVTFYCKSPYTNDIFQGFLMYYYDSYQEYARRNNIFPEMDFAQIANSQIDEALNWSLKQNLDNILAAKTNLQNKNNKSTSEQNYIQNAPDNSNFSEQKINTEQSNNNNNNRISEVQFSSENEKIQIVCLIDPSEFCYVKEASVLKNSQVDDQRQNYTPLYSNFFGENYEFLSQIFEEFHDQVDLLKYQRIPTNFFIDNSNQVTIEGYISGLTPRINYSKLYIDLEKIFQFFVPLFENCLYKLYEQYDTFYSQKLFLLSEPFKKRQKILKEQSLSEKYQQLMMEQSCLKNQKIQVFVKAVEYKFQHGEKFQGEWQIQGCQKHENVVAIGIYCCELSDNFSDFGVEFRRAINIDEITAVEKKYNTHPPFKTDKAEIILGSVHFQQNRCIVFPNNVQHRITTFQQKINNKNEEKVKKCKILYFYLVDPKQKIISSSDVKIQSWQENKFLFEMELQKISKRLLGQSLPQIVIEKILSGAKTGFDREEELVHREKIKQAAQKYNDTLSGAITRSIFFSLCSDW